MKIPCTALYALILLCYPLKAQEPELTLQPLTDEIASVSILPSVGTEPTGESGKDGKWQLGVTAGYFHSTIDWVTSGAGIEYSSKDHIRSHPGSTVGFAASYPFGEVWSLDTGVNLSMWGFGYRSADISMRSDRYAVEVPVLITFFESAAYIPVFIQAGILGGFTAGGVNKITQPYSGEAWEKLPSW